MVGSAGAANYRRPSVDPLRTHETSHYLPEEQFQGWYVDTHRRQAKYIG